MELAIPETSSEQSDERENSDELLMNDRNSLLSDSQSMESRTKPINLGQHALELEEDEIEDELIQQQKQESIYNVSGYSSNFRVTPTELYGFMVWLLSALFTILFSVWAWTPDSVLNNLGIHYLPNKYYVIAFPHWVGVTFLCYNLAQDACCMIKSHPRHSLFTLSDRFTKLSQPRQQIENEIPVVEQIAAKNIKITSSRQNFKERKEKSAANQQQTATKRKDGRISEIQDIPITVVNNVLYSKYMNQSYFD